MSIFTTEGIVLKRSNFGEAGRILTIVTPFKGKIKALAKGVRRMTSRRGGNVEMLNKVRVQIFQGKGMNLLTEAESLETFQKIKANLILSTYGSHVVELAERLLPEDQPNPEVYNLLLIILTLLEKSPRQIFIRAYEVKLLAALGFWSLDQVSTNDEIKNILGDLQTKTWEEIDKIEMNKNQALEVERILRYYIERVLEGKLKSVELLNNLKRDF